MDLATFKETLTRPAPSDGLSLSLQALWWDAKGDWDQAHECAQAQDDKDGARIHAYLHRKEGDASNASYWYRRAGTKPFIGSLAEEGRNWHAPFSSRCKTAQPLGSASEQFDDRQQQDRHRHENRGNRQDCG